MHSTEVGGDRGELVVVPEWRLVPPETGEVAAGLDIHISMLTWYSCS